ncbi:tail fiber protein [Muricauda brasiliensis]|uniref:tail fiber protein n=1 Tax=Muricauda brasiliensis TaxID=2162892 RepID=UPI000D336940|nr:tail fiber protein [Muricauda brasiliensis]
MGHRKIIILVVLYCFIGPRSLFGQAVYDGSTKHTFTTDYGVFEIGPMNAAYGHIYTDRPRIIFNRPIWTSANIFSSYDGDLVLQTEGNERLRIDDNSGNIGIGTANPQHKLELKGKLYLNSGPDDDGILWARHNMTLGTISGSYNHNVLMLKPGGASNGFLHSQLQMYVAHSEADHEKKVQIHTFGNSYFNGGNVGIGTANPDAKLAVKGDIHAQEVKVDLSVPGPDYVFKEGYALKSLEEVENYIKLNGHLPNIPSAKDMEENGVQLGEMNMRLLEKIEELTLYILQLEKKTNRLNDIEKRLVMLEKTQR